MHTFNQLVSVIMSMPGSQPIQTPEEQEFKNPRKSLPDNIPNWLKVFIKERVSKTPHHHVIVPATANHTAFILGAQPDC